MPVLTAAADRRLVAAALGRLTWEHRDVLRECYFLGSSVPQAAHALGIAPGTVKSRTYYALRALRLAIEELRDVEMTASLPSAASGGTRRARRVREGGWCR